MLKVKRFIRGNNFKWSFVICLIFSLSIIPFASIIAAFALNMTDDPTANIGIATLSAIIFSAICSGVFTSLYKKDCSLGHNVLVAICVVLIMLIIGLIINKGNFSASALMNYGCYLGIFCMSAYLSKQKKRRKRHIR